MISVKRIVLPALLTLLSASLAYGSDLMIANPEDLLPLVARGTPESGLGCYFVLEAANLWPEISPYASGFGRISFWVSMAVINSVAGGIPKVYSKPMYFVFYLDPKQKRDPIIVDDNNKVVGEYKIISQTEDKAKLHLTIRIGNIKPPEKFATDNKLSKDAVKFDQIEFDLNYHSIPLRAKLP
jgi:hypothetical protein